MVQLIGACAINYSAEAFRVMDMMTMTRIIWQIRFKLAINPQSVVIPFRMNGTFCGEICYQ